MTSYSLNTVQITALKSERKILKKNGVNTCNVWFEKISISPPPTEGIGFSRGKGASICLIFQWEAGGGGGGTMGKFFRGVLVTRERVTKKNTKIYHNNLFAKI